MNRTWILDERQRPTFEEIVILLQRSLSSGIEEEYLTPLAVSQDGATPSVSFEKRRYCATECT